MLVYLRVNFIKENTLSDQKVSKLRYILEWVIYLLLNIVVLMTTLFA